MWALLSKLCPDGFCLLSFAVVRDVSGCGRELKVRHRQTNSSCCSLQATNQSRCNGPVDFKVLACFFCTSGLLAGSRASHWDGRPTTEGSSAHSGAPSYVIPVLKLADWYCRPRTTLRGDCCFSASFAVNVAGILRRLRNHCGTRVCSVSRSNKCATHVLRTQDPKAVWSRRVQTTQSLVGQHA